MIPFRSKLKPNALVTDIDASIESHAKCTIRECWINSSGTQEYSLHHWLKHKKKCIWIKKAMEAEFMDPVDVWKVMDTDPDLKVLESINCSTTCARRSVLITICHAHHNSLYYQWIILSGHSCKSSCCDPAVFAWVGSQSRLTEDS
jgi:hypothetical protein